MEEPYELLGEDALEEEPGEGEENIKLPRFTPSLLLRETGEETLTEVGRVIIPVVLACCFSMLLT